MNETSSGVAHAEETFAGKGTTTLQLSAISAAPERVQVIFLHKATKTLLVTDSVVCIPRDPPPIINGGDLLQSAAEEGEDALPDSPENRRKVMLVPLAQPAALFAKGIVGYE